MVKWRQTYEAEEGLDHGAVVDLSCGLDHGAGAGLDRGAEDETIEDQMGLYH